MKTLFKYIIAIFALTACFFFLLSTSCKKDNDDKPDNQNIFWNENWLIGTWEATTPVTGDPKFDSRKIKLIFTEVDLKETDTVPHNTVKLWHYSGTLLWDVNDAGVALWSMNFHHSEYPGGLNLIGWQSATMLEANVTINNISLRIGDTVNMDPNPEYDFDLDWGPYNDYTRAIPTYLDFYGDIEIYQNGENYRADYPPDAGTMIRFTKK